MRKQTADTILVSSFTFLSRITGLLRDIVFAAFVGASWMSDAFFVAFSLPNMMRRIFAEGLAAPAFVPCFVRAKEKGEKLARVFSEILGFMLKLTVPICIAGIIFAPIIISIFAPGFEARTHELSSGILRVTFPYIILVTVAVITSSYLNSQGIFGLPASVFFMFNLSLIGTGVIFYFLGLGIVWGFAVGVLIGGLVQVFAQVPSTVKGGIKFLPSSAKSEYTESIKSAFAPVLAAGTIYQVNLLVSRALASFLPEGSISYLWYASRFLELPLGVFIYSISTVSVPFLASKDERGTFQWSVKSSLFVTIPATVGLCVLSERIIGIFFMRGEFAQADVIATSSALLFYSIGLPFIGLARVLTVFYQSKGILKIPVQSSALSFVVNVLLTVALMRLMGHAGVALATSISSLAGLLFLVAKLERKEEFLGVLKDGVKMLVSAMIMGGACFVVDGIHTKGFTQSVALLTGEVLLGAALYFTLCRISGVLSFSR